jgi:hypothetical protein
MDYSAQVYKQIHKNIYFSFQCNKDITVDYMQQCPDEPNMAFVLRDIVVVQINKYQSAFSGTIELLKTVGEPWKVNIFHRQPDLCSDFIIGTSLRQFLEESKMHLMHQSLALLNKYFITLCIKFFISLN